MRICNKNRHKGGLSFVPVLVCVNCSGCGASLFGFGLGGGPLDDEVVVYAEGAGGGVGLHTRDGLVAVIVDDAVEGDVAVFYDNVDGMEAARGIVGDAAGRSGDATARCL